MGVARRRSRIVSLLAASAALCALEARGAGNKVNLQFTGMIAFADGPANTMEVLLLNQHGKSIHHAPLLELNCAQLVDSATREDCLNFWLPSADRTSTMRVMSLDRGYEIRLTLGTIRKEATIDFDSTFVSKVIALGALVPGAEAPLEDGAVLRSEVLDPGQSSRFLAARVLQGDGSRLTGGRLRADLLDDSGWRFQVNPSSEPVLRTNEVANRVWWDFDYEPGTKVVVELRKFGSEKPQKTLQLMSQGDLQLVFSNEPDEHQFCASIPKSPNQPFPHFAEFWNLSRLARTSAGALARLPLPYADHPERSCPEVAMNHDVDEVRGRHGNCMKARFRSIEP